MKIKKFKFSNKKLFEQAGKIRTEVFIIGQKCPEDEEFDGLDKNSTHYLVYYNNLPAATGRWRKTDQGIKLERFAVLDKFRGKGLGNVLIESMLKDTVKYNETIYLFSQIQVTGLYEKFGFKIVGDSFNEVGIKHYKMIFVSLK